MSTHNSALGWPDSLPDSLLKHVTATGLAKDLHKLTEHLASDSWLLSKLQQLQAFRPPSIKPQHIASKRSYEHIIAQGWLVKSEETALAWKLNGNSAFQHGDIEEALRCYNAMICCAVQPTTAFTGISNKASCYYKLKDWSICLALDTYCMEKETKQEPARQSKLEARILSCKEKLHAIENAQSRGTPVKDLETPATSSGPIIEELDDDDDSPPPLEDASVPSTAATSSNTRLARSSNDATTKTSVRTLPQFGNSLVASTTINPGETVFSTPQSPVVGLLSERFRSQRCASCFMSLDSTPIISCKHCTHGFCSEACASTTHPTGCDIPAFILAPMNSVLGFYAAVAFPSSEESLKPAQEHSASSSSSDSSVGSSPSKILSTLQGHAADMPVESLTLWAVHAVLISKLRPSPSIPAVDILKYTLISIINGFYVTTIEQSSSSPSHSGSIFETNQVRIGLALYDVPSYFNHSCRPNTSHYFFKGTNKLVFRAVETISAGEQLFHCYGPYAPKIGLNARRRALRNQYHFVCRCTACIAESEKLAAAPKDLEISFRNEVDLNDSLHEYLGSRAAEIAASDSLTQLKSILAEEEATYAQLEAVQGGESDANNSHFARSLELVKSLLALRMRKYKQVCVITAGKGFNMATDPNMPDSYEIQHEMAFLADKAAYYLSHLHEASEEAILYSSRSLSILTRWLPPHSVELAYENEKLAELVVRYMEATKDEKWLDLAKKASEKAHNIFTLNYGPDYVSVNPGILR